MTSNVSTVSSFVANGHQAENMDYCIVVQAYLHKEARDLLSDRCRIVMCESDDEGVAMARKEKALALVPGPMWELSGAVFDRIPSLLVVARLGIGVDKVDVAAATDRGESAAEHEPGRAFAAYRGLHRKLSKKNGAGCRPANPANPGSSAAGSFGQSRGLGFPPAATAHGVKDNAEMARNS